MPFTTEQFFAMFAQYNAAVWPAPLLLNALAVLLLALLFTGAAGARSVAGLLAALWAWTGVAYHWSFFSQINPAAWLFGALSLAGAAVFVWLAIARRGLPRAAAGPRAWLGWALVAYALAVYPLLGAALGHRYPAVPTFGAPCPSTIFTLGVLLLTSAPRPAWIVPLLWSAVGASAAVLLAVPQDFGLAAAGLIGLWAGIIFPPPPARTEH